MRICFLATADNPHVLRWIRYLAGRGHEVLCLCDARRPPARFLEMPPCEVRHPAPNLAEAVLCFKVWRHRFGWHFFRARSYCEAVRAFAPDIVHGMEALAFGYATARCAEFTRVLTPWGNDILAEPKTSRIARRLVTYALRHVEAITTNMPNLAEVVAGEYGVDPARVRPFSWGIDLDVFRPGYEDEVGRLRREWEIPDGAVVFLSNRQNRPHWGIGEIAAAVPEVIRREPRAFFVFLRGRGDPEFEAMLRRGIEEAGCADRVRWVAELLDDRRMAAALNLAHAFVSVPHSDLLSISVLEGMACGAVPVAADLPAYRERLRDGENAVVVDARVPVDSGRLVGALVNVVAHPEWKPRFAERNLALVREHDDWRKNAALMEDLYRWAVANPLGPKTSGAKLQES